MKQWVLKDEQSPKFIIVPDKIAEDRARTHAFAFSNGISDYVIEQEVVVNAPN